MTRLAIVFVLDAVFARSPVLIALALVVGSLAWCPAEGSTQPSRTTRAFHHGADADTWNARAAVGELGWRAPDDAYAAIVEVHIHRARITGTTTAHMARRYSAAVRRPPPHRAWVPELHARTAASPPSWPPHLDGVWWRYAERFDAVRDVVRDVLRGERAPVCPEAEHYGGPMDSMDEDRWERACSIEGTAQRWWKRIGNGIGNEGTGGQG